ncbi:MAG: hypothetical protein IJ716_03525 [Lachnospiraceae bacterium]|nr:hypothetical protein [Lachnospiraceae bacterium]
MGILEIVLLLAGAAVAIVSFVIPSQKEEMPKESKKMAQDEVRAIIDKEMDLIRQHVDDVVDESIEYAVEKTERSLERLTNEKIMAVNEYSDTVLREIHKNHEEAMFLYDMLNAKHTNIKNTVSEVNRTVKEAAERKQEAEAEADAFRQLKPEPVAEAVKTVEAVPAQNAQVVSPVVMDFMTSGQKAGVANNNGRILELHKQGMSKTAIAKELGLGVGEVKLVIDLYNNLFIREDAAESGAES